MGADDGKESKSSEATLRLGQRGHGKNRDKLKVNNNLQSDGDRRMQINKK